MVQTVLKDTEEKMKKAVEALRKDFQSIRAGRANPALLDKIQVDYYGVPTPLNQVANISAPEARLLVIQPWDKSVLGDIEKAILKSDLDLTPNNDGNIIRIAIPQLTEERRKELVKIVKKKAEEYRVVIRNIRREANDEIKKMEKNGEISEDEMHRSQDEVQELTNQYIEKIDGVLKNKEAEIMEV
ncbi:MAG: ribosome recycling factor [Clostridia bacterium]|jgi:ribosome recycling factor|nr:ribosome recycling factor [Clostridia bacterium]